MDDEGENEFVGEQAITKTLGGSSYNKVRRAEGLYTFSELERWQLDGGPRVVRYVVTSIIMQKNGAPLHTGLALYWDTKTDGTSCVQVGTDTMDCITTVFACMI
eukprot:Skav217241  [mRNA]  locus=scaffold110:191125:194044:+ [translate_table: standard]